MQTHTSNTKAILLLTAPLIAVYVRSTGSRSTALDALGKKGALSWPEPQDVEAFNALFDQSPSIIAAEIPVPLCLFSDDGVPKYGTGRVPEKPEKQSRQPDIPPRRRRKAARFRPAIVHYQSLRAIILPLPTLPAAEASRQRVMPRTTSLYISWP